MNKTGGFLKKQVVTEGSNFESTSIGGLTMSGGDMNSTMNCSFINPKSIGKGSKNKTMRTTMFEAIKEHGTNRNMATKSRNYTPLIGLESSVDSGNARLLTKATTPFLLNRTHNTTNMSA